MSPLRGVNYEQLTSQKKAKLPQLSEDSFYKIRPVNILVLPTAWVSVEGQPVRNTAVEVDLQGPTVARVWPVQTFLPPPQSLTC